MEIRRVGSNRWSPDQVSEKESRKDPRAFFARHWIPIQDEVLCAITKKLVAGGYNSNKQNLIADLSKDIGLLGRMFYLLPEYVDETYKSFMPTDIITTLPAEVLEKILKDIQSETPVHTLDPKSAYQVSSLKRFITTTSASEILSKKSNANPSEAYLASFARKFGDVLTAWNYPRIYQRLSANATRDASTFEAELVKLLGFSPYRVGAELLFGWNTSNHLTTVLSHLGDKHDGSEMQPWWVNITEIADMIARCSDPETFPVTSDQWSSIMTRLAPFGGAKTLNDISVCVEDRIKSYASDLPTLSTFKLDPTLLVAQSSKKVGKEKIAATTHIMQVEDFLLPRFEEVYSLLKPNKVSPEAVAKLITTIIPAAGFRGGCIFLDNDEKAVLTPTVRFGNLQWLISKEINYGEALQVSNPVIQALFSTYPLSQVRMSKDFEPITIITGNFGTTTRKGVLYLEGVGDETKSNQIISLFKAISEALTDCLALRG
jgi:hypothetical protein